MSCVAGGSNMAQTDQDTAGRWCRQQGAPSAVAEADPAACRERPGPEQRDPAVGTDSIGPHSMSWTSIL